MDNFTLIQKKRNDYKHHKKDRIQALRMHAREKKMQSVHTKKQQQQLGIYLRYGKRHGSINIIVCI